MKIIKAVGFVILLSAFTNSAKATVFNFLDQGFNSTFTNLQLQGLINAKLVDLGAGAAMDVAPGGGLQLENLDLTVSGGPGFILNFDHAISSVRLRGSNAKDDANITLRAYEFAIEYDDRAGFEGFVNQVGDASNALLFNAEAVALNTGGPIMSPARVEFDVLVVDPTTSIRSLFVQADSFLWAVNELEFTFADEVSAIPLPASLPLFGSGLVAMGLFGWRRKKNTRLAA